MEHPSTPDHDAAHELRFHLPQGNLPGTDADMVSVALSSRRTGMSFQRTRMSADRTLMSVIRTSLSLITFGFTIQQAFHRLHEAKILESSASPTRFGLALVLLGIALLSAGIIYQVWFMRGLRRERETMKEAGLIYAQSQYPVALSLLVAVSLLAIGILAALSILFNVGPFG